MSDYSRVRKLTPEGLQEIKAEQGHKESTRRSEASRIGAPLDMKYLMRALIKYNASDLHLKVGRPPLFRVNGNLVPSNMPDLNSEQVGSLVQEIMTEFHWAELERKRHVDLSFVVENYGRFRCNVYYQRGELSVAVRMIPILIPRLEELNVPLVLRELCQRRQGLILITGATGSGKSTTLAGMVQYINEMSRVHILTVEDPIEFLFKDNKAMITQREVGTDTDTLAEAMRAGLRQDPDVIMIGELRDHEMIRGALTAAETGHLVIATLHTRDARGTFDRIIDVFPEGERLQVRMQLASALIAIVSQQLVQRTNEAGRIPACEVMIKSPAIESYILRNQLEKINEAIASSTDYYKMQTMNQSLEALIKVGKITQEEGLRASPNPEDLRLRLSGIAREEGYELAFGSGK